MKRFLKDLAGFLMLVFILTTPVLVMAQSGSSAATSPSGSSAVAPPSGSSANSVTQLQNPLINVGNFCDLLKQIFNDLLVLGIPVATLFIVLAGFQLVTARGNETQLTKAKNNLWYIVIGVALFLGAWTLAQIIANTLAQLGGGGGIC